MFPLQSTSLSSALSTVMGTCSGTRDFFCHSSYWYCTSGLLNGERFYEDIQNDLNGMNLQKDLMVQMGSSGYHTLTGPNGNR